MKRFLSIVIVLLIVARFSWSQSSYFAIGYNMAAPLGNTADFISSFSYRGVNAEQRFFLTGNMLTIGYNFSWQVFNKQIENYTQTFDNGAAYGNQYRYINVIPMQATVHYHLLPESFVRPYFGGGLGAFRQIIVTDMGLYTESHRSWNLGFSPEAGALFDYWEKFNLMAALRYNYAFKNGSADSFSSLGINISAVWVY